MQILSHFMPPPLIDKMCIDSHFNLSLTHRTDDFGAGTTPVVLLVVLHVHQHEGKGK